MTNFDHGKGRHSPVDPGTMPPADPWLETAPTSPIEYDATAAAHSRPPLDPTIPEQTLPEQTRPERTRAEQTRPEQTAPDPRQPDPTRADDAAAAWPPEASDGRPWQPEASDGRPWLPATDTDPWRTEAGDRARRRGWWWAVAVLALLGFLGAAVLLPLYRDWLNNTDKSGPAVHATTQPTVAHGPGPRAGGGQPRDNTGQNRDNTKPAGPANPTPGGVLVTYEVTSSGPNDVGRVVYTDAKGDFIRRGGVPFPFRVTFRVTGDRKPTLILDPQRTAGDNGTVTCSITYAGKELSRTTATGRYAAPECVG